MIRYTFSDCAFHALVADLTGSIRLKLPVQLLAIK